jgi:DMSO/TMAO reductase YedYZ molybdopterin-dependent catalytic subunit
VTVYTLGRVVPLIITTFTVYGFTPLLTNALMHNYISSEEEDEGVIDGGMDKPVYLEMENLSKLKTVK